MNERTIFMEALERETPAERSDYLDAACAGDAALRQRVEALLRSHEQAGEFLGKPPAERLAEQRVKPDEFGATHGETAADDKDSEPLGLLAPSDRPDALGRLGHYVVQEVIGRGGMGVVFRAFDEKLHRVVAIKVMAAPLAINATARKRFVREAQAAAAIRNEHVIDIHAVDEANALPYLAMEYVAGVSLQERLDRSGPLELKEVLRIGMQTAAGLAAAHAQGVIHRDVKPANILLENGVERVRLTDFGLARAVDDASLTQSGVVAGTPQYMSPEQAEGKAVDHRSDLFSLGSVLYAMCTGRAPFRASGSMAVLKRVCEETPTPIRETNPEIPDWLVAIIDRLHAKNPAERFQSAAEVAELLGRHLAQVQHPSVAQLPATDSPVSGGREPPDSAGSSGGFGPPLAKHRRWAIAAAVVLCLLGCLSLTEATGVTNLRATVIRIFTPDGTLVVETDDPAVKVTVEGDGGLVITGAGLEEIRLRPGSYRVQADRDGKPVKLDRDLVTISKGGKEVVKVRLVGEAPTRLSMGREVRRFPGHTSNVWKLAISADDRRALSGSSDASLRWWEVSTGRQLRLFEGVTSSVIDLALSGDGRRVLTGSSDKLMRLWDADGSKELLRFKGHTDQVIGVALSPDGQRALSGSHDKTMRLWNVQTGKELHRFEGYTGSVKSVAFSPDGRLALSAGKDGMWLWEIETGKKLRKFPGGHWSAVFSPNGRRILSGDFARVLQVWDVQTGAEVFRLEGHSDTITEVAISPDGRRALSSSSDRTVRLWDLQTRKEVAPFKGHPEKVQCVAFSRDGLHALSGDVGGTIILWELPEPVDTKPGSKAESQAFVVLGGKGVEVRKFDTLAEAVQGASDGDTIEIRGNGPFVSDPILIQGRSLTIRAGANFRPVFQLSSNITTDSPLVLEGLELQRLGEKVQVPAPSEEALVCSRRESSSLYLANCRFREHLAAPCVFTRAQSYLVLNCEFLSMHLTAVTWSYPPGRQRVIDNCVVVGKDAIDGVRYQGGDLRARLLASPWKLTPEGFRLRADSAGYRAGKDLGADVGLVGPGPAYERWKKTPAYQQWLKDTKQEKK
jgi:serine/threonine protein kinase/WD40 repeat protein